MDDLQVETQLSNDVQAVIWELISQGLLRPGQRFEPRVSNQAESLPWLTVTPHGTKCFAARGYVPYDADGYLAKLTHDVPGIDRVALMYLGEALATFRSNHYLAAAVMVGVASEKLILVLHDAVASALDSPDKKQKFEVATEGKLVKVKYEEIRKRIIDKLNPSIEEAVRVH